MLGARYIIEPDYYTYARIEDRAHWRNRIRTVTNGPGDNGAISLPPPSASTTPRSPTTVSCGTRTRTDDGTVPRNRPRQGAFQHRERRPRQTSPRVVVTSASINGTLDVTRRPNFPSSRPQSWCVCVAPYRHAFDRQPSILARLSSRFMLRT